MTVKFVDDLSMAYLIVGWLWWRRQALVELSEITKLWNFALSGTQVSSTQYLNLDRARKRALVRQQRELDWQPVTQRRLR